MGSRSRSRSSSAEADTKASVHSDSPVDKRRSSDRYDRKRPSEGRHKSDDRDLSPDDRRRSVDDTQKSPNDRAKSSVDRKKSRSRSRSSSHENRRRSSRSQSRGRRRSRSLSPADVGYRLHLADIGTRPDKYTIEKSFSKYGKILETWVAENPPCFAFIVFQEKEDAEDALEEMNGATMFGQRIRVSWAKPRNKGGRAAAAGGSDMRSFSRPSYGNDMRCYNCGRFGHLARNCYDRRSFRGRYVHICSVYLNIACVWAFANFGIYL
ncbi:hypothetical protein EB796_011431 [Bugula neritina]|uniref:Uncharacterized protein n=1 Tax=Bugula neritina TaxID=10212 RepID=A0A7J7JV38_BUGNE|nr:hypothetical protein EB796_011431 [Bugula neritina]